MQRWGRDRAAPPTRLNARFPVISRRPLLASHPLKLMPCSLGRERLQGQQGSWAQGGPCSVPGEVLKQGGQVQRHRQLVQLQRAHVAAGAAQQRQQALLAVGLPVEPAATCIPSLKPSVHLLDSAG